VDELDVVLLELEVVEEHTRGSVGQIPEFRHD